MFNYATRFPEDISEHYGATMLHQRPRSEPTPLSLKSKTERLIDHALFPLFPVVVIAVGIVAVLVEVLSK
jgi:hypothetical protein